MVRDLLNTLGALFATQVELNDDNSLSLRWQVSERIPKEDQRAI